MIKNITITIGKNDIVLTLDEFEKLKRDIAALSGVNFAPSPLTKFVMPAAYPIPARGNTGNPFSLYPNYDITINSDSKIKMEEV